VLAALGDRQVGVEKAVADGLQESEATIETPFVQVVEEQSADAAGFVAVLEVKVFVAPLLVTWVHVVAERLAQIAGNGVPLPAVFIEGIERRQVETASEPPHRIRALLAGFEITHVRVCGRYVRVLRMDHQRHAGRGPVASDHFRPMCGRGWRQRFAGDA
jgi:hypothetical protein